MPKVSAIIITKNEEEDLARCLESIKWVDEIVLIDSGSTDRTLEIAKNYKARIFVEEWKGYTEQKNSCLDKAEHEWVLSLDADEELTMEAQKTIQKILKGNEDRYAGYALRRRVLYLGKWITHGDWYPDYVVRLWKKNSGRFKGGRVHESVEINGPVKHLKCDILHYTYKDLQDQRRRMEKYSKLWAQDRFDRKQPFRTIDLLLRPPARFLRGLILKSGWLDGWRGFLIAWMCAREVSMKYKHLKNLYQSTTTSSPSSNKELPA